MLFFKICVNGVREERRGEEKIENEKMKDQKNMKYICWLCSYLIFQINDIEIYVVYLFKENF